MSLYRFFLWLVPLLFAGCGGAQVQRKVMLHAGRGTSPTSSSMSGKKAEAALRKKAAARFSKAMQSFLVHDRKNDWTLPQGRAVAQAFEAAVAGANSPSEAIYNAGVALQRCGDLSGARAQFRKALARDPHCHFARAVLAMDQYRKDGRLDDAITTLQKAVTDAQSRNVFALIQLAVLQMQRDSTQGTAVCTDDLDCAKKNLQQALALDDSSMPALNQLALCVFQQAKKKGLLTAQASHGVSVPLDTQSMRGRRADVQQLELALLICSQAIQKDKTYAPIHHTAGLIFYELGQTNNALRSFAQATQWDSTLFEAQRNYAALNLSFRDFERAEKAYQKALALRPNDYEARLGYALALRGQIRDTNYATQVKAVQAELDKAKSLDRNRPDAYYNEGIFLHEYKSQGGGDTATTLKSLEDAKKVLALFVQKAGTAAVYQDAVLRAQERMQDIDATMQFLRPEGAQNP